MRVIAGAHKGRILKTAHDLSVRPATGKVRAAIFNVLQNRIDLTGARILDLYAGSGSLGIEALSRGAQSVVFVEKSQSTLRFLRQNLASVREERRTEVRSGDALEYLRTVREEFDIVFADPPYALEELPHLPAEIFRRGAVAEEGFLIIEHPAEIFFAADSRYEKVVEKKYGRTRVTFFTHSRSRQTEP